MDPWCFIWRTTNLLWTCLPILGGYIPNLNAILRNEQPKFQFFFFFSSLPYFSFHTNHKNHPNLGMHALIGLKFGTHVGKPKVNKSIKFGDDPTKIRVVINDYCRKQKLICRPVSQWCVSLWITFPQSHTTFSVYACFPNKGTSDMRFPTMVSTHTDWYLSISLPLVTADNFYCYCISCISFFLLCTATTAACWCCYTACCYCLLVQNLL